MKVRIQRISRTEGFTPLPVDTKLMEATIPEIRPGIELNVNFSRISEGVLHTTKVERVQYLSDGMHIYTKNSIYRVLVGWDE